MSEADWGSGFGRAIAVYLNGDGIPDRDTRGQRVKDDTFLICFSAHDAAIEFTLPGSDYGKQWRVIIDTAQSKLDVGEAVSAGGTVPVGPRAMVVLHRLTVSESAPRPAAATAPETLEIDPPALRPRRSPGPN